MPENTQPNVLSGLTPQATPTAAPAPEARSGQSDAAAIEQLKTKFAEVTPIRKVRDGEVAATWVPKNAQGPLVEAMRENYELLFDLGLGLYNSSHDVYVLFNPELIGQNELQAFDTAGNTLTALPAFDSFLQGGEAPTAGKVQTTASPQVLPTPVSPPAGQPLPASSAAMVTNQRLDNITPGTPTERPRPGQGQVLNSLLKRAT